MAIVVRPADLGRDRDRLIRLIRGYLCAEAGEARFDWLYRNNPFGEAQAWIASDPDTGEAAGMAALFPRTMYVDGLQVPACVLGDFCVDPGNRSLGPALLLQRACLAGVKSGRWRVAYDLPSRSMLAVYSRLGYRNVRQSIRYARLLRSDEKLGRLLGSGPLTSVLGKVVDIALQAAARTPKSPRGLELAGFGGPCGEEFTDLSAKTADRYGVATLRTGAYLQWRYFDHPMRRYEMIVARQSGKLQGFVVYTLDGAQGRVADLCGPDPLTLQVLLSVAASGLKSLGAATASCSCVEHSPLEQVLRRSGFKPREASPVVALDRELGGQGNENRAWFLLDGDRES